MSLVPSPIDRIRELGGSLTLEGEKIKYRIPADSEEARELLAEVRKDREAYIALLRDRESKPPTIEEVRATLPSGVKLVSYHPKQTPFPVAPVSVITNAGKFFQAYLRDLHWRMEHPDRCAAPPLRDILAKLADAGLELQLEESSRSAGNIIRALPEGR